MFLPLNTRTLSGLVQNMTVALNYQFRIKSKGLSSHMANIIQGYYCLFVYLIN